MNGDLDLTLRRGEAGESGKEKDDPENSADPEEKTEQ
jgi:hypothetical protein